MKRYVILSLVLLTVLFGVGCASGGCSSCKTVTPTYTPETDATEPPATEPPETPEYIGIGLQEPKTLDLPASQKPSADQAFDAILRNVMASNEYRAEANKYYQFTRYSDNILILLSHADSLICSYDAKTYDVTLVICDRPEIRDLHTNGTITVNEATTDYGSSYALYLIPDVSQFSTINTLRPLWRIMGDGTRSRYFIWEADSRGEYISSEVSEEEFFAFAAQTKAPAVEWCDLNAGNVKRVIACESPIDKLYPADFADYVSTIKTMRGITELCRQAYLLRYTLGLDNSQILNEYREPYKTFFDIADEASEQILSELIELCVLNLPTYQNDHNIEDLFAYCIKDLNSDGVDELLLMRRSGVSNIVTYPFVDNNTAIPVKNDTANNVPGIVDQPETDTTSVREYLVFAVLTLSDGKVELLGSYPDGAWIDADGQIICDGKVERIGADGALETIEHFGVNSNTNGVLQYFKTVDGKRVMISREEYVEIKNKYALPEDQKHYVEKVLRIIPARVSDEAYTLKPKTPGNNTNLPSIVVPDYSGTIIPG